MVRGLESFCCFINDEKNNVAVFAESSIHSHCVNSHVVTWGTCFEGVEEFA
jgi:hypothetical protein